MKMAEEEVELACRLLKDLNSVFSREISIDEYDFLPVLSPTTNRSPVIVEGSKLAIELWAVKLLYTMSYQVLIQKKLSHQSDLQEVLPHTRAVLMVNPDCAFAWNIRKENLLQGHINAVDDLRLGALILRKHPKSPETFAHRKWLLQQLLTLPATAGSSKPSHGLRVSPRQLATPEVLVTQELNLCEIAADKYPNNYNAWTHRIWLIQTYRDSKNEILPREQQVSKQWVETHVSDHSGCHYRMYILTELATSKTQTEAVSHFKSELQRNTELITLYPGHEALWVYRRNLVHKIQQVVIPWKPFSSASEVDREKPQAPQGYKWKTARLIGNTEYRSKQNSSTASVHQGERLGINVEDVDVTLKDEATSRQCATTIVNDRSFSPESRVKRMRTNGDSSFLSRELEFATKVQGFGDTIDWQATLAKRYKDWINRLLQSAQQSFPCSSA